MTKKVLVLALLCSAPLFAQNEFKKPEGLAPAPGYTHVVVTRPGKLIYLSGQVGNDTSGQILGKGDLKVQTEQVFANLKTALAAAGATFDDVVNLARRLNEAGVSYILVGGYALNAHGYTRATEDVDILVAPGRANGEKVVSALLKLPEKAALELDPQWFEEGDTIRIGGEFVIDLLFRAAGHSWEELSPYVEVIDVVGVPIRTLNIDGLLLTKQTYRDKDKIDRLVLERAIAEKKRREGR